MKLLQHPILKKIFPYACLLVIICVGIFLRHHAVSPYLVYSDSYQPLVVAENIKDYGSPLAPLGDQGMLYPQYVGWSRPFLPLLVNFVQLITNFDSMLSAQLIVFMASVISIPLAYVLVYKLYKRQVAGLFAAFLLAISYNHIVWSGFILTESLALFLVLLLTLLLVLIIQSDSQTKRALLNLLAGMVFTAVVATRYELCVLLVPFTYILWRSKKLGKESTFMLVGIALSLALLYKLVGPFPYDVRETINQNISTMLFGGVVITSLSLLTILMRFFADKMKTDIVKSKGFQVSAIAVLFLALLMLFVQLNTTGLIRFVTHDYLLVLSSVIGLVALLKKSNNRYIVFTGLLTTVALYFIYYLVNPAMERYLSYTIPLLIIASGYAAITVQDLLTKNKKYRVFIFILPVLFLPQIIGSYYGLHNTKDNAWFRLGYEEVAARLVYTDIEPDQIIIASMPEPYRLFTGASVQSIAQSWPFIPLSGYAANQSLMIVNDAGMKEYFPDFYTFVDEKLSRYKTETYAIDEPLRTRTDITENPAPVEVYTLTVEQLQAAL